MTSSPITLQKYLTDNAGCNDQDHITFTQQFLSEIANLSSTELANLGTKLTNCKDKINDSTSQVILEEMAENINSGVSNVPNARILAQNSSLQSEIDKYQQLIDTVKQITTFTTTDQVTSYTIPPELVENSEENSELINGIKEMRKAVIEAQRPEVDTEDEPEPDPNVLVDDEIGPQTPETEITEEETEEAADLAKERAIVLSSLDIKILLNNNKRSGSAIPVIKDTLINNWASKPDSEMITLETPAGFTMVTNKKENIINDTWSKGSGMDDTAMDNLTKFKEGTTMKALMLFGSSGSGKTYNASRIIKSLYKNFILEDIDLYYGTIDIDLDTESIITKSEAFKFSEKVNYTPSAVRGLGKNIKMSFDDIRNKFNELQDGDKIINFTTLINRQQGYVRQTINNPQSSRGSTVYKFTNDEQTFYLIDAPGSEDPFTILKGIFKYIRLNFLLNNHYIAKFFGEGTNIRGLIKDTSIKNLTRSDVLKNLPDKSQILAPWKGDNPINESFAYVDSGDIDDQEYVDITEKLSDDDKINKKLRKIIVQLFMNFYTNSIKPPNYSTSNLYNFIPKEINELEILIGEAGTQKNIKDYNKFYKEATNLGFITDEDTTKTIFLGKVEDGDLRYGPSKSTDIWGDIKGSIFKIIDNTRELIIQSYYITFQIGYISSIIRMKNKEIKKSFDQKLSVMVFGDDEKIQHFDMFDQEKFGYFIDNIDSIRSLLSDAKLSGDYTGVHENLTIDIITSDKNQDLFKLGRDIFLQDDIDITSLIVIPKTATSEKLVNNTISVNSKSIIDQLIGFPKPSAGGSKLGRSYSKLRRFSRKNLNGSGKINRNNNYRIKIKHSISTKKNKRVKTKKIKYLKKVTNKRRKIKRRKHKGMSLKRKTR